MSEHQHVLDQGEHSLNGAGGGGSQYPLNPRNFPFDSRVSDYTPAPDQYERQERQVLSNILSEQQINKLKITNKSEMNSAEWYARISERVGKYNDAEKIYSRLLHAQETAQGPDQGAIRHTLADLRRVHLCQKAENLERSLQFLEAVFAYGSALESIDHADNLDTRLKFQLAVPLMRKLNDKQTATYLAMPILAITRAHGTRIDAAQNICKKAEKQIGGYRKALQCLDLADQLNSTGWRLEQRGLYSEAQRMYRESLAIKIKNLGPNSRETTGQYGEIAKLYADQKKYPEAKEIYEKALANFRAMPDPGSTYGAMLQNYGDMLAQIKETKKADAIYDEARSYYKRADAVKQQENKLPTSTIH